MKKQIVFSPKHSLYLLLVIHYLLQTNILDSLIFIQHECFVNWWKKGIKNGWGCLSFIDIDTNNYDRLVFTARYISKVFLSNSISLYITEIINSSAWKKKKFHIKTFWEKLNHKVSDNIYVKQHWLTCHCVGLI